MANIHPNLPQATPAVQKQLEQAEQLRRAEKWNEALTRADRALATARTVKDDVGEAKACQFLGSLLGHRGKHSEAINAYKQSATIWMRLKQSHRVTEVADSLNTLAILAYEQNDRETARNYYANSLTIQKEAFGSLKLIVPTLHDHGRQSRKRNLLVKTKASSLLRKKLPPQDFIHNDLTLSGNKAYARGDLQAAASYYRRALAIQKQRGSDSLHVARSFNNLGIVAYDRGDLKAAAKYFSDAIEIQQRLAPQSLDMARSLNNAGNVAYQQKNLRLARNYYTQALAIQKELDPESLDVARSFNNLGVVTHSLGDFKTALKYYSLALSIQQRMAPQSIEPARSLNNLGEVAYDQGNLGRATEYYRRAWDLQHSLLPSLIGDEARIANETQFSGISTRLILLQVMSGMVRDAFDTLEASRAQALKYTIIEQQILNQLRFPRNNHQESLYVEYKEACNSQERAMIELSAAASRISRIRALRDRPHGERTLKYTQDLQTAENAFESAQTAYTEARLRTAAVLAQIRQENPIKVPPPLRVQQLQQVLPAKMLYVTWVFSSNESVLFLLEHGKQPMAVVLNITPADLHKRIDGFRIALSQQQGNSPVLLGRALFNRLFPVEVRSRILQADRLLLAPDGPLWSVPLAALVTNPTGPPRFLGLEKPLSYTPSLSVFAEVQKRPRSIARINQIHCLAVGNPRFSRTSDTRTGTMQTATAPRKLPGKSRRITLSANTIDEYGTDAPVLWGTETPPSEVPSTGEQATHIAALYGARPLTREEATEANVRRKLPEVNIIHIASHGRFLDTLPMGSGVLLTVPEKKPLPGEHENDGALQAWEFLSMKLKADIAVFGACEVGLGEVVQGEGILGMARSLQIAGVRSAVVGLWSVDDVATRDLMIAFHRYCRSGKARDEALRLAMKSVATSNQYRHPYYWAPFILVGDNSPLIATLPPSTGSSGKKQPQASRPLRK